VFRGGSKGNGYGQWQSQELAKAGDKKGSGNGSPPVGSKGRAPLGIWGQSPQKMETNVAEGYTETQ